MSAGTLAGAVLLAASKAGVLALESVGFADIASGIPMRPDTVFWIASMTKPFTSTALMMLVEEGRVHLDDPVERYLPEFNGQMLLVSQEAEPALLREPKHPITVREILSHTSGLPFRSPLEWPTLDRHALQVAVESYAVENLRFEPGSKYEYSNEGTNTAGRIIEVVTGLPYEKFLNERLLFPLEMSDTVFIPNSEQVRRLAKPYRLNPAGTGLDESPIEFLSYPLTDPTRQPIPGGGLFATAADVARFCRMILRGGELDGTRYLSETSIREMTRKQTREEISDQYGLGWAIEGPAFGHGGALGTHMWINPQSGLITIYLLAYGGSVGDLKASHDRFVAAAGALPGIPSPSPLKQTPSCKI